MRFESGEILYERRFALKTKGEVYRICVRSAILHGNETWCLREREVKLLRTERAMIRAMCGVKLIDQKNTKELIQMLGVTVSMLRAAAVRWYGHVLRREDGIILKGH